MKLETDLGPIFAAPVGWRRLYLKWMFRHFRSLRLQILTPRQRRIVEELWQSSALDSANNVDLTRVIGTIEGLRIPLSIGVRDAAPAIVEAPVVVERAASAGARLDSAHISAPETKTRREPKPAPQVKPIAVIVKSTERPSAATPVKTSARAFPLRIALTFAAVACVMTAATILVTRPSMLSTFRQIARAAAPAARSTTAVAAPTVPQTALSSAKPSQQPRNSDLSRATVAPKPAIPAIAELSAPKTNVAQRQPPPLTPDRPVTSGTTRVISRPLPATTASQPSQHEKPLPLVLQAAQKHVVYPTVSNANLRGLVSLEAVVGPDGAVKNVHVVQGNPSLARSAAQALREWQFVPYSVNGQPTAFETRVTVNFLGDDAVTLIFNP